MSIKNVKGLFESLTPKTEYKEKMFYEIFAKSKNNKKEKRGFTPVKRLRPAMLTTALVICFLATTAFAAVYLGLDAKFLSFLNPSSNEQAEYLANGAYVVDKKVVNENGTLEIKQAIGDSNLTYILMDFTAPKDVVLDAARYWFENDDFSAGQNFYTSGRGFILIDDENPNDNKISLIREIVAEKSTMGSTANVSFENLQAAAPFPAEFKTVVSGKWETSFELNFKDYSTTYQFDTNMSMFGYEATLKTISISPISVTLKLNSRSMKEINEASGGSKEISPNEYLDNFPITINYKDGTSETTSVAHGPTFSDYGKGEMHTVKTFENVINDKEIESIVFFDTIIPIN